MTTRVRDMEYMGRMLDSFRRHMRIIGTDLDSELMQKLKASVAAAENHIRKTIVPSTLSDAHKFSSSFILTAPVISVESVSVDDVILDSEKYELNGQVLSLDESVSGQRVKFTYRSGFEMIPDDMMAAILLHAAYLFNNPVDTVETLPKASDALLAPYRSWGEVDYGE